MNKARIMAIIYWGFAMWVAIFGAIYISDEGPFKSGQPDIPAEVKMVFSLFAFGFGLINGFLTSRKLNKITWFDKALDRLFGIGFSDALRRELHIPILFPSFFILAGGIGLLKAQITGFSGPAMLFFSVLLFLGIGLSFGFSIYWLFSDRKKNA